MTSGTGPTGKRIVAGGLESRGLDQWAEEEAEERRKKSTNRGPPH